MQTKRELYEKLNSWVNKCGGDRAFAARISEAPKKVQELIYSSASLMERFGFVTIEDDDGNNNVEQ